MIDHDNRVFVLPALIEDKPIYRVTLTVKPKIRHVATFNEDTTIERDGQRLELLVVDLHEVVAIHYE